MLMVVPHKTWDVTGCVICGFSLVPSAGVLSL